MKIRNLIQKEFKKPIQMTKQITKQNHNTGFAKKSQIA